MSQAYVRSETHQSVTTVEFFHPQGNSLPGEILAKLAKTIRHLSNDEATKVIVLRSAGESAFCAGASFAELRSLNRFEDAVHFFSGFAHVINAMRECEKFIVGRIHGKCVGGGVGLVAALDYAIATEGADVKLSELSLGFGPFVVGPAVERKIGKAAFSYLSTDSSNWRNADWAKRKGLYSELHPGKEDMDEAVRSLALRLSHYSAAAMKELKKILWDGTEHWEKLLPERAKISARLLLEEEAQRAIAAVAKRN
jgi:methylglutaconyl-CoA hydratase